MVETLLDSYSGANQSKDSEIKEVHPSVGGNCSAFGQVITASKTAKVTKAKFVLKKVLSPVGHLRVALYAESSGKPIGSILADSGNFGMAALGAGYSLKTLAFSTPYKITKGVKYCLIVYAHDATTLDAANYVSVGTDNVTLGHSGTFTYHCAGTWTADATTDCCFYLYGIVVGSSKGNPLLVLLMESLVTAGINAKKQYRRLTASNILD